MGSLARHLLLTAKRQAMLSRQLQKLHLHHEAEGYECPGCRLEAAMEWQMQMAKTEQQRSIRIAANCM